MIPTVFQVVLPTDYRVNTQKDALRVMSYQLAQRNLLMHKQAPKIASMLLIIFRGRDEGVHTFEHFITYAYKAKLHQFVTLQCKVPANESTCVACEVSTMWDLGNVMTKVRIPPYVSHRRIKRLMSNMEKNEANPIAPEYTVVRCEWAEKGGGIWKGEEKVCPTPLPAKPSQPPCLEAIAPWYQCCRP